MALVVASASIATAVMPTSVPGAAFSATLSAAALASVMGPTPNSLTSATAIVKPWVEKLPSAEVARTTMPCEVAVSASRRSGYRHHSGHAVDGEEAAGAVVQAVGDGVGARVGVRGRSSDSYGCAHDGVLGDRVGAGIGIAHRSDIELVDIGHRDGIGLRREAAIRRGRAHHDVVRCGGFGVERTGHRHHPGRAVDREAATSADVQAVGNGVGGGIRIGGRGGDAHQRAHRSVLRHAVGRRIGVADRTHVELVHVTQGNGEGLGAEAAVGRGRPHHDAVAGRGFPVQRPGHRHHAGAARRSQSARRHRCRVCR